jgi:hypothetical protein
MRSLLVLTIACALACAAACRGRSGKDSGKSPAVAVSAPAQLASAPARAGPSRLPEDPIAGARSVAQWQEHLREEERERKADHDRRKLKDHRAVVALLRDARARYDRAKTKAAVVRLQTELVPATAAIRQRIDKIDRWGGSSNLLTDYSKLLETLAGPYPNARIAAIAGDDAELSGLARETDARMQKVTDWLAYVEGERDGGDGDQPRQRAGLDPPQHH